MVVHYTFQRHIGQKKDDRDTPCQYPYGRKTSRQNSSVLEIGEYWYESESRIVRESCRPQRKQKDTRHEKRDDPYIEQYKITQRPVSRN